MSTARNQEVVGCDSNKSATFGFCHLELNAVPEEMKQDIQVAEQENKTKARFRMPTSGLLSSKTEPARISFKVREPNQVGEFGGFVGSLFLCQHIARRIVPCGVQLEVFGTSTVTGPGPSSRSESAQVPQKV